MSSVTEIALSGKTPHPLDAIRVAPDHHEIPFENDQVRVLDTRPGPGERTPVDTHQWPAVLYIRYDPAGNVLVDSKTMTEKPAVGTSLWSAPLIPHYVHNIGELELRVIAVELKAS